MSVEAVSGPVERREERAVAGIGNAVEQALLDPDVVVEVLEVDEPVERERRMQMDRRTAVQRQRQVVRPAQTVDAQQLGDPSAPGHVGLEHVDGAGLEHPAEVERVIPVLAGGDRHAGGSVVAHGVQALEVLGADRLLEPAHVRLAAEPLGELERLFARVGAVGVDEQLGVRPDRLARLAHPLAGRPAARSPPSSSRGECPARPSRSAAPGAAQSDTR